MKITKKIFSLSIILLLSLLTFAQKPYTIVRTDRFTEPWRWKLFEELNGKQIMVFTSDEEGIMHFLSRKNLYTYDGYNWEDFPIPDNKIVHGLRLNIWSLPSGIVFGGADLMFHFKDGVHTEISPPKIDGYRNLLNDIIEVEEGFYVTALTYGIYVKRNNERFFYTTREYKNQLDTVIDNFKVIPLPYDTKKEVRLNAMAILDEGDNTFKVMLNPGRFKLSATISPNPDSELPLVIHTIREDKKSKQYAHAPLTLQSKNKDEYWVVTGSLGLPAFHNTSQGETVYDFEELYGDRNSLSSIVELNDGKVIMGGEGQIYTFEGNERMRYSMPKIPVTSTGYIQIAPTPDDHVWMGGQNGEIFRFSYSYINLVVIKNIFYQMEESAQKIRWFLTHDNGAVRRYKREWLYFSQKDGLVDEPIKIIETSDNIICCAGRFKNEVALSFFIDNKWKIFPLPEVKIDIDKRAFYPDRNGNIWIGTIPGPTGETVKLNQHAIKYFLKNGKRNYKPLITNENDTIPEVEIFPELGNHCVGIAQGVGDEMYVADQRYLTKKVGDKIERFESIRGKKSFLCSSKDGKTIWLGTEDKGLYKVTEDTVINYNLNNGLVSNIIVDVIVDSDSTLWVATEKDISRYIHGNWINNCFPKQFNIVKEGGDINALPNGFLWFSIVPRSWVLKRSSRMKNLETYSDEFFAVRISPDTVPPETKIEFFTPKVSADGNTHITWKGIDKWDETDQDEMLFSYKLNDANWSKFENKHDNTFLSLHHGKYTLHVKAMDKYGNIDKTPDSIKFIVMPPVYLRWWFLAMVLIFISTIAFLVSRIILRNKKLAENNFELKEQKEEILAQNEEIQQQSEEISAQRDNLQEQNEEIKSKNEEINAKNKAIKESINYAKSIQSAFMPTQEQLDRYLNCFVLFKPKDIVSGDFTWFSAIEKDESQPLKAFICVADCTGHGVPGALVSMVGNNLLHETINLMGEHNPAQILEMVNAGFQIALKQDETRNNDGMDIALVLLEEERPKTEDRSNSRLPSSVFRLVFSGAKNPCVIYRAETGKVEILKGSRKSIGGLRAKRSKQFYEKHESIVQKGDVIYLLTDGIIDQHNQERERFTRDKLYKLLEKIGGKKIKEQKQIIEKELNEHMKEEKQTDDISLIGIKI